MSGERTYTKDTRQGTRPSQNPKGSIMELKISAVYGDGFGVYSKVARGTYKLLATLATREQAERFVARVEAVEARKATA